MRWSQSFLPTLREDPADAEAASHKLLVRAGFVRPVGAGIWAYLPPAQRTMNRITAILREEMGRIGAQEFYLPALHPAEIWKESGRWQRIGADMFRLKDRKGSDYCLGMTHEEVFTAIARDGLSSYRQLPQIWYQIQVKFRDEPRPKSGVIRDRQFTMKDAYSFDVDEKGLDRSYDLHRQAYERIFTRSGLAFTMVEASSGAMGGSASAEFIVESAAGEDTILSCACGYAANREKGRSAVPPVQDPVVKGAPERFPTPGVRTIEDLARFVGGAPADRQVKTLVMIVESKPVLVLLRGDHTLEEEKMKTALGTGTYRPATPEECVHALGAHPGSLGAVGVKGMAIHADEALRGRRGMATGANADDFHLRGVDVERDIAVTAWADLRQAQGGEPCVRCGKPLKAFKGIEVGHIFKLGTRYSESMKATVTDAGGRQIPIVMGSYGIGLERIMACAVELWHDAKGISWPASIAPFQILVTSLSAKDEGVVNTSRAIHESLLARGVDSLWDDRDANAGVKLNDADLVGIPLRITVGPRKIKEGKVELAVRRTGEVREIPADQAAEAALARLPTLP
ncbi:MAG: proline--tRNA ligase [Planctomycetes bacterium]|nr:proline--tRNA ligase [Planctomycetota bacterium]